MSKVIGIDISKKTFDVCILRSEGSHSEVINNTPKGYFSFLKEVSRGDHVVMEASGPYYLPLAMFLHERQIKVSVINPLVIRRFTQMNLQRAKTDKKDAQAIALYGKIHQPSAWSPDEKHIHHIKQLFSTIQGIGNQLGANKKRLDSFEATGVLSNTVTKTMLKIIAVLKKEKRQLEEELNRITEEHFETNYNLLQTIPGIGPKTAALLTAVTNNFNKFDNYRQLIAYVGFSPRVYQSGTSIRGKGHICKLGSSHVRRLLYMCSWTAKTSNKGCRQMYERLKAKGKPERVIKVALANKLLKQAFAVINKQMEYDENYVSKACF